jgi:hypothetical protein
LALLLLLPQVLMPVLKPVCSERKSSPEPKACSERKVLPEPKACFEQKDLPELKASTKGVPLLC